MYQGADHVTGRPRAGQGARRGAVRRWAALAIPLVMFLLTMGISTFPTAGVVSAATVDRVAGADRYQTAVDVARLVGGGSLTGLDRLILVTGERFPDGLVASGLAGYLDEGGRSGRTAILLTQTESLPAAVARAITASRVAASDVVVVGGSSAVSAGVHAAIARAAGWNGQGANPVTRIAGQTRYETAAAVVEYVVDAAGGGLADSYRTVLVANGENFPDALAGGALAYRNGHLLVLSRPPAAPKVSRDAIGDLRANCAVLLGGPVALSNVVGSQVNEDLTGQGCGFDRLGGADRYETAASIADRMRFTAGSPTRVVLASGINFTDALVAAPLAARNTPILFTSPRGLPAATTAWLQANRGTLTQIQILGGTSAVPQTVANAAAAAATSSSEDNNNGGGDDNNNGGGGDGGGGGGGGGGDGGGGDGDAPATWPAVAGGASQDRGNSIAALSDGSGAIVVGGFIGTATFGATTLVNSDNTSSFEDVFVAKLGASGSWLWAVKAGGPGNDIANDVVALTGGSALVIGRFGGTAIFGSHSVTSVGLEDAFVAKISANGEWEWAVSAGSSGNAYGTGIAALADGSAIVTGNFAGTATFTPTQSASVSLTSAGSEDAFVAKISADGKWVWAARAGASSSDSGSAVSVLTDGSGAIVTGEFRGTATFTPTQSASVSLTSAGNADAFVAKISADGEWVWAARAGGSSYDYWECCFGLSDGSAIVTGHIEDSASTTFTPVTSGATPIPWPGGGDDAFAAKISAGGEWLWAARVAGGFVEGTAVSVLSDGSAIVTGYFFGGASFTPVPSTAVSISLTNSGSADVFVAKISADGEWIWAAGAGGTGFEEAEGLTVLSDGKILITGFFSGTASFGETSVSSAGGDDIFVARLSDAGVFG
jgi:putative cell wall-binding protein